MPDDAALMSEVLKANAYMAAGDSAPIAWAKVRAPVGRSGTELVAPQRDKAKQRELEAKVPSPNLNAADAATGMLVLAEEDAWTHVEKTSTRTSDALLLRAAESTRLGLLPAPPTEGG